MYICRTRHLIPASNTHTAAAFSLSYMYVFSLFVHTHGAELKRENALVICGGRFAIVRPQWQISRSITIARRDTHTRRPTAAYMCFAVQGARVCHSFVALEIPAGRLFASSADKHFVTLSREKRLLIAHTLRHFFYFSL